MFTKSHGAKFQNTRTFLSQHTSSVFGIVGRGVTLISLIRRLREDMHWLQINGFSLSICVVRKVIFLQILKELRSFEMPLTACRSLCKKMVNGIDIHVKLS